MEEINFKAFANEIAGAGFTRKEVCDKAGISEATFSKAVNGHSSMVTDTFNKVIRAFNELKEEK